MEGKRKGGGGNGAKSKKAKYFMKMHAMGKGPYTGKKGILVTCDQNKEKNSIQEMYRLLEEYSEKCYPEEVKDNEKDEKQSIADELEDEIKMLQQESKEKKQRFKAHETGCKGTFFMAVNDPRIDTVAFVKNIFLDLEKSNTPKTRYTNRVIPVQKTCPATEEEITKVAQSIIDPIFNQEGNDFKKYAVMYTCRNNSDMDRDSVIRQIWQKVHLKNMVDLKHPEWVILVEINKKTCCLAVTTEYSRFNKFNIRSCVKVENQAAKAKTVETIKTEDDSKESKEEKEEPAIVDDKPADSNSKQ